MRQNSCYAFYCVHPAHVPRMSETYAAPCSTTLQSSHGVCTAGCWSFTKRPQSIRLDTCYTTLHAVRLNMATVCPITHAVATLSLSLSHTRTRAHARTRTHTHAHAHTHTHTHTHTRCQGLVLCQGHSMLHQAAQGLAGSGQGGTTNPASICRSSRCSWNGSAPAGSPASCRRCGCAPSCASWPQTPSPAWPATPCRLALTHHLCQAPTRACQPGAACMGGFPRQE